MKFQKVWVLGAVLLGVLFLTGGCSKSTNPVEATDPEALKNILTESALLVTSDVTTTTPPDTSGGYARLAGVDTVKFWWRRYTRAQRNIAIQIFPNDSAHVYPYALVTITDSLYGVLHVLGRDSLGARFHDSTLFADLARRNAYFEKRFASNRLHRGWVLVSVSGVVINSIPFGVSSVATTRQIQSAQVVAPSGVNKTLTEADVLALVRRDSLTFFRPGDSVTVTVTTADSSDSVYLHVGEDYRYQRKPFRNNLNGTFTGTWVISTDPRFWFGPKHAGIDVIKHDVLDGDLAYDSKRWGLVYVIQP